MMDDIKQVIEFLYDLPRFTKKNSIEHTARLLRRLGEPCYDKRVIHVAGSNGKGSVCCFLYNMLLAEGHSAGLFTSPHLVDIRERFQVNGELVGEGEFLLAFRRVKEAADRMAKAGDSYPTFFEMVYAMAMLIFEEEKVEYIVLETGLGGRLDATNSFPSPILSVITSVSLEHTEILGDTIEQIAAEKAGIIRPGVPVVYAANEPAAAEVIEGRAAVLETPVIFVDLSPASLAISEIKVNSIDFSYISYYDNCDFDFKRSWHINSCALYQAGNAALAIEAMRTLGLMDDEAMQRGLNGARWPGRMDEVLPGIYFDGAHNPAGMEAFLESVRVLTADDIRPPLLLFSMVKEKDIEASVRLLTAGFAWDAVIVTAIPEKRGADAEHLGSAFGTEGISAEIIYDCADALDAARSRKHSGQKLFAAGSLHFIGDLMALLRDKEEEHEF